MRPFLAVLLLLPILQDRPPQEPPKIAPPDADLVALAGRCGRDVRWRKENNLDAAASEAEKTGRLILAYVYDRRQSNRFGNGFKDQFMMGGAFADPDLVAYINRKFIPARFYMDPEFAEEIGTRLNDVVVPAILFLDPDRKILLKYDSITSTSPELLFRTCRTLLEKNPAFNKPGPELADREKAVADRPGDARARYLLGLELLREGEWEKALAVFADVVKRAPNTREAVESLYRSAGVHRLLRKGPEAIAAVDTALKANRSVGAKLDGDLLLEKALVFLGQKKRGDARDILQEILRDHPKGIRTPEAAYYLGAVQWMSDLEDEAKKTWTAVAKGSSANPWARKAAAEALENGPFVNGWESYEWMSSDLLTGDTRGTEKPRKPEEYPEVVSTAVAYLLREQRKDGTWRNVQGQFELRNSITMIGLMALSEWDAQHAEGNRAARDRARTFADAWSDRRTGAEGMDIWEHMFAVFLYSRMLPGTADDAAKKAIRKRLKRSIRALETVQRPKGTWSYVGMGPSSFTTGGVLVALWEAKQAGIEIDKEVVDRAFEGLFLMKTEQGTYYYSDQSSDMFEGGKDGEPTGDANPAGSAGRMAVCYLAEFLWGKCDLAKLTWAMDVFLKNKIRLLKVRKSTDWHAGKYANASYFFFYDYWFASMAMLKIPEKDRGPYLAAIRNDLLETNEVDGSWVDTHLFGKSYGTAMALMILKNTGKP
ncbi:MAG TPA: tetratricopeptide repeat protein [Planctomycetota bacterium]|nr:tetratricopeptide repeat protein [Planctomycetota bacterium]